MDKIGLYFVPLIIALTVIWGAVKKVDLFESFREGAKEGISSLISVAPSLMGLIIAVNMLSGSGFFELTSAYLGPVCSKLGIPPEVIPLGLIRPVSGSGSFAVLSSLLERYGPDSSVGKIASVMAGSTETTFYAIAVYYGAAGVKKTGCTVPAALLADFCSVVFAVMTVQVTETHF